MVMGLAGGLVRRVFSKGRSRECNERSSVDTSAGKSKWAHTLRLYLCGDELKSNQIDEQEGDKDDLVSQTLYNENYTNMQIVQENAREEKINPVFMMENVKKEEEKTEEENFRGNSLKEENAATLIQSAFRGFVVRRGFKEMKKTNEFECKEGLGFPNAAISIATSTEVQIGESFISNHGFGEESVTLNHRVSCQNGRPPVFLVKEEWDDSTVSCNVSKMRIQNRLEATTRRERALAYAFSQQLRTCNSKKRLSRCDLTEPNVGWSWLERWMATRNNTENPQAEDCMSNNNTLEFFIPTNRKTILIKKRLDVSFEGKESCGSNDVSANFDGFKSSSENSRNGCNRNNLKNRGKGASRSVPRRKFVLDNGCSTRSSKVSKKEPQKATEREEVNKKQEETNYQQEEIKVSDSC